MGIFIETFQTTSSDRNIFRDNAIFGYREYYANRGTVLSRAFLYPRIFDVPVF
ncbi:MAG: hypothetical protein ACD_48C00177G0001 [uncultured bacterium]|nr:MAG: hypothetical protein ACD_48C00177G0001 [uncultured bacterium]